ncbi:beta strand repeat-containing protein [Nitrospirillum amazonense]|uniref:beta strand repeat-containing protein n=1 Tax=Nitrospirillum amazonense TaxID=28077 RepID=UPI002412D987|nr:calcium-binding protein [Nitrospirillum amazonense]MDG3442400.1 calcium-binding protein [Nitrospirillum amazonense]
MTSSWSDVEALSYIASYSDLIAAFGANPQAGLAHYNSSGQVEGRTVTFDALAYIASNPDLIAAYGANAEAGAIHYITTGHMEGRAVTFDGLAYIASYADLIAAFGTNTQAGITHYITTGHIEGRTVTFNGLAYIASYGDLIAAFGANADAGATHYITTGHIEGRTVTFDGLAYIASYGDLIAAFGANADAGATHYITTGHTEGRTVTFDGVAYLLSHPSLAGLGVEGAITQWIQHGYAQGNDNGSAMFGHEQTSHGFGLGLAVTGAVDTAGDHDWYQLTLTTGQQLAVELTMAPGTGVLTIYDASGRQVATASPTTGTVVLPFTASQAGTYYVVVNAGDSATTGNYTLNAINAAIGAAGNDSLTVDMGLDSIVTLGAGSDTLTLAQANGHYAGRNATVTDFTVGTDQLKLGHFLGQTLKGWDGVSNPFADGFLQLVQSGNDTLLQIDVDGAADSWTTLVTLQNTTASTFTAQDLGYTPAPWIAGTANADTIFGTSQSDLIMGLNGNDTLSGGSGGNDTLEGGGGSDSLTGGAGNDVLYGNNAANAGGDTDNDTLADSAGGNDQLYGQDGNDYLSVSRYSGAASSVLMDGGTGDDFIYFKGSGDRFLDTVTMVGGTGNDTISVEAAAHATIDAGAGDDTVIITPTKYFGTGAGTSDNTITLGSGADTLVLKSSFDGFSASTSITITDFQTGTDHLNLTDFLSGMLTGWNGTTNPFAGGFLRLVQSGSDSLLQVDLDGGGDSWSNLITFQNTTASTFTTSDLMYDPTGSAPTNQTLVGTAGSDTLTGGQGNDLIQGLAGNDILTGGFGNDTLEGGSGYDVLNGGSGDDVLYGNNAANTGGDTGDDRLTDDQGGNDQLYGQDGNDTLTVTRYTSTATETILMDGGSGNDTISFYGSGRQTVTILGGSGNDAISANALAQGTIDAGDGDDTLSLEGVGQKTVDAGAGNDTVSIILGFGVGATTLTLGTGSDTVALTQSGTSVDSDVSLTVTDFQPGTDKVVLDNYLPYVLTGWDGASNPFGNGYLQLVQAGNDTLLQIDPDGNGAASGWTTLITFQNTTASTFTYHDLEFSPDGSNSDQTVTGTAGNDTLTGGGGSDLVQGLGGDDVLSGGMGNDTLEGGSGSDSLDGGAGDDILYGNNAANTGGDTGNDTLADSAGGNDQLYGQDGNDYLSVSRYSGAASSVLMDGGTGDDFIYFKGSGDRFLDTVTMVGGTGNDTISVEAAAHATIDAGAGDDTVIITPTKFFGTGAGTSDNTITLGSGADTLVLKSSFDGFSASTSITVTDFQTGTDHLNLTDFLSGMLTGWSTTTNPFDGGYLQLKQSGGDTLLQVDLNGGGDSWSTLMTLQNTTATSFTAADLGYIPTRIT